MLPVAVPEKASEIPAGVMNDPVAPFLSQTHPLQKLIWKVYSVAKSRCGISAVVVEPTVLSEGMITHPVAFAVFQSESPTVPLPIVVIMICAVFPRMILTECAVIVPTDTHDQLPGVLPELDARVSSVFSMFARFPDIIVFTRVGSGSPQLRIALRISSRERFGYRLHARAAIPLTCGVAIEVHERRVY